MHAICRIKKHHRSSLASCDAHNSRRPGHEESYKHADPNGTIDKIIGGDFTLTENVDSIINKTQAKEAKNSVVAVELMLSASPEYFRDPAWQWGVYDEEKTQKWLEETTRFLEKKYGRERIAEIVVHLDEATPHVHAMIVPVVEKTKNRRRTKEQIKSGDNAETYVQSTLDAKNMFNKYELIDLQTEYAQALKPLGLERGKRKSKAKHMAVKTYYGLVNQDLELKNTPLKIPKIPAPPIFFGKKDWIAQQNQSLKDFAKKIGDKYVRAMRAAKTYKTRWIKAQRELQTEKSAQNVVSGMGGAEEVLNLNKELKKENVALKANISALESEFDNLVDYKDSIEKGLTDNLSSLLDENKALREETRKLTAMNRILTRKNNPDGTELSN